MAAAPIFDVDLQKLWQDPYPTLETMRAEAPFAFVPQLHMHVLTRHKDISDFIKQGFGSNDGAAPVMDLLMGKNLMMKEGKPHMAERTAIMPTISPKAVRDVWTAKFHQIVSDVLDDIAPKGGADMVKDIAMRISAEALKVVTGLTQITWQEMDRVSQAMMDGLANVIQDPEVAARCNEATAAIERYIDERIPELSANPDTSLLSIHLQSGMSEEQYRANVKLAISGGQNEPRDVLAGAVWAMSTHPEQLQLVRDGKASWNNVFDEYNRWISPIGFVTRRVVKPFELNGITLNPDQIVCLYYASANRDEDKFENPTVFDLSQNSKDHIAFGMGAHFCAGARIARCLIADISLPAIFERLPNLRLDSPAQFGGFAFRGALAMPVSWDVV